MSMVAAAAFTTFAAQARPQETTEVYRVDTKESSVEWTGKKVTGEHTGHIHLKSGQLEMQGNKPTGGTFVIDMPSLSNTDLEDKEMNQKLVGHLKSDDFFGVDKHPTSTLVIKDVVAKGGNEYLLKGDITIKGITEPIEFPATIQVNGKEVTAKGNITIDRAKHDVRYGSGSFFDNLGDKMIYDEFDLAVDLVMKK